MSGPVGVMDSGFGGLSVVSQFLQHLPQESIFYFGDNARVPYGSRPQREIQEFVLEIGEFLVEQGVKVLVIACNTATAAALPELQGAVSVPVVGIIEPGARQAVATTVTGEIGVVATDYTINSRSYQDTIVRLQQGAKVYGQACPLFVPFVEKGRVEGHQVEAAAREYLTFLAGTRIDTLVLGCTHYPHLTGLIRRVVGTDLKIVDPAQATVDAVRETLAQQGTLAVEGSEVGHRFYTSADPEQFRRIGQQLLGYAMDYVEQVPVRMGAV